LLYYHFPLTIKTVRTFVPKRFSFHAEFCYDFYLFDSNVLWKRGRDERAERRNRIILRSFSRDSSRRKI